MNNQMINVKTKIAGEYRLVLNDGTSREADTGWFDNLVLDAGLNRLGNTGGASNQLAWLSVGTGAVAPAVSDTSLGVSLASTNTITTSTGVNLGASTYASQLTNQYTFAQGAVIGNLTECGVGTTTGGGNLFSRSLIVNAVGSPTALTVGSTDQLTVYYRVTITPVIADLSGSVTLSGTAYPYTARLSSATTFFSNIGYELGMTGGGPWGLALMSATYGTGATLGAITASPSGGTSGTGAAGNTYSRGAYTNGSFYVDTTMTIAPANFNPPGGIVCMTVLFGNSEGSYQYQFSTAIPKDNTKTLIMVVRYSWGR